MLWRHGDVLIATTPSLPADAQPRNSPVLVYGEATGHAHRIEDPATAEVWIANGELFLRVMTVTRIIHEEHRPITLDPGIYRVWQQREYTPQAIQRIID
jgi:hypothetical protein